MVSPTLRLLLTFAALLLAAAPAAQAQQGGSSDSPFATITLLHAQTPAPAPKPAPSPKACISGDDFGRARGYARRRPGTVAFAVIENGKLRSERGGVPFRSASLVKAMVLAADLRRHARIGAWPDAGTRARHRAMITRSDNKVASAMFNRVGSRGLYAVARSVGMKRFRNGGYWGQSELTASDQARFFLYMNAAFPKRFQGYARNLLRSIVPSQTWGASRVARRKGFTTMFKSGWLPRSGGWVVHQGLRLERGRCTIGVAVLTGRQPSMSTGVETMRGIAERLL